MSYTIKHLYPKIYNAVLEDVVVVDDDDDDKKKKSSSNNSKTKHDGCKIVEFHDAPPSGGRVKVADWIVAHCEIHLSAFMNYPTRAKYPFVGKDETNLALQGSVTHALKKLYESGENRFMETKAS